MGEIPSQPPPAGASSKKNGKTTLRRQWAHVFSQRLNFIRDKLESRSHQSENTKWLYVNSSGKKNQNGMRHWIILCGILIINSIIYLMNGCDFIHYTGKHRYFRMTIIIVNVV